MNAIDVIIIICLTYFVYRGAVQGLIGELLGATGWIMATVLALRFGGWAGKKIVAYIQIPANLVDIAGFVVMLLVVRAFIQIVLMGLRKSLDPKTHDATNKLLGAVIGFIKGAFLVSIFVLALSVIPLGEKMSRYEKESALFPHMAKFARALLSRVVHFVPQTQPQPISPPQTPSLKNPT
jgi:membrane protein required for colicin V production